MELGRIREYLAPHGVEHVGVCRFASCLPMLPCRAAARVPAGACSVILCLFPWRIGRFAERNVSHYAIPADYHLIAGNILQGLVERLLAVYPAERFAAFVDNSPLREVDAASRAGLGVVGRHGLLIHPTYGCAVFIGAVVTTLELPATESAAASCLGCGRCAAACPTGAISWEQPFNRARCRSFITQKKGALTPWEAEQVRAGKLAWGCDICVDACPTGAGALTPIEAFYHNPVPVLTLPMLDRLPADRAYAYRGRAVLERNLMILREKA